MEIAIVKSIIEDFNILQILFCNMFELFPENQNINYPKTENGINYINDKINNGLSYSAKVNNDIVGFIFGSINKSLPFKTYEKYGFIENLFVLKEVRKYNIGTKLIESFINECNKKNVYVIETDSDLNQNLVNFYIKNNFKICGINYIKICDK